MYRIDDQEIEDTEDMEINGGIFEIINPEDKFKPLSYIFEGDYFSLYPTIILAFNISPETYVDKSLVTPENALQFY